MALDTYRSAKRSWDRRSEDRVSRLLGIWGGGGFGSSPAISADSSLGGAHGDIPICTLPAGEVILYE